MTRARDRRAASATRSIAASRSSAAAPAPACRPAARRRAGSTSSSSTIPAAIAWPGRGSLAGLLAYGNANDIVVEMAREVLPVVRHTPVLAGVNGTDPFLMRTTVPARAARPRLRRHPELPDRRTHRRHLPGESRGDRDGLRPRGRAGRRRARRGSAHHALRLLRRRRPRDDRAPAPTSSSATWASPPADRSARRPRSRWTTASHSSTNGRRRPARSATTSSCSCHGGPVSSPDDAAYVLSRTRTCHGFYGASAWSACPPRRRSSSRRARSRAALPDPTRADPEVADDVTDHAQ